MRRISAIIAVLASLLGASAAAAAADPVAYIQVVQPVTCQLHSLDVTTGVATPIGTPGDDCAVALARSGDGTLFGVGVDAQGAAQLSTIDRATGLATAVGPVGFGVQGPTFFALTVDPLDRMWLYANSGAAPCASTTGSSCLYRIDRATGEGTLVGASEVLVSSLASTCTGELRATTWPGAFLLAVDPDTGATSSIGPVGQGLVLQGAAGGPDGVLWALDAMVAELPYRTVAIDPSTGVGTVAATITGMVEPFDAGGLALTPPVCATPSTTTTAAASPAAVEVTPAFTG